MFRKGRLGSVFIFVFLLLFVFIIRSGGKVVFFFVVRERVERDRSFS